MAQDARFEDGNDRPLRLLAMDGADLEVISALTQDAVFPVTEIKWQKSRRRFALLVNRFRWEDQAGAQQRGRPVERVQAVLMFSDVEKVQVQGINQSDNHLVLSLLSIALEPGEDGTGRVVLTLAGDGAIALEVETLDARLEDVTRPYLAPSRQTPHHPE